MATMEDLEALDGFAPLRNGLRRMADQTATWAGIPMPLEGLPLVIEPNFPNAEKLQSFGQTPPAVDFDDDNIGSVRNAFWSDRLRAEIWIYEEAGKICHIRFPRVHGFQYLLNTLGASDAWGIEQESNAVLLLARLLPHRKFKQYMLTGTFLERSPRSGVMYLFRWLRPTVAISMRGDHARVMCALCLHPIGLYDRSWAGAMSPTDDVVAHLMLMRGDEHMFWKRANQHPAGRPEAGL